MRPEEVRHARSGSEQHLTNGGDGGSQKLAEEKVEPLPPRRRRRGRGRGRRRLGRGRAVGDHHQRPIAGLHESQLLARDRFDRGIAARPLDLLLQSDVVLAIRADLHPQGIDLLIEAIVLQRLLPGRDQRVQDDRHREHRGESQRQWRWTEWTASDHALPSPYPLIKPFTEGEGAAHALASAMRRCSAGCVASSTSAQRGGRCSIRFWHPMRSIAPAKAPGSRVSWSAKWSAADSSWRDHQLSTGDASRKKNSVT